MGGLMQDLRFALRMLRRSPWMTLLVVGSLALAIAGNVTVFSIVNSILFRPLPFAEPERVVVVGEIQDPSNAGFITPASAANFVDWRRRQSSLFSMAAYRSAPANLEQEEQPVTVAQVTTGFLPLLGVEPLAGRSFTDEEGVPGNDRVLVLDHRFWQSRYGDQKPEAVLGRTLEVNGVPHTVIGVLPERFQFFDPAVQLWAPLALDLATLSRERRDLLVLGRLRPGVTTEQAGVEMAALGEQLAAEHPQDNRGYQVQTLNLREQIPDSRNRRIFALMQGAMLAVLLIACANITNLLLARVQGRVTELAVRSSMGAGRHRILRQLLTEMLTMAALGGLLGLALGSLGIRLVSDVLATNIPSYWLPSLDLGVLAFTAAVSVAGALLAAFAPMAQAMKIDIHEALKEGGRGTAGSRRRRLLANGLVVAEICLALVLLAGASVLIRTFVDLQHSDPGFETANLLSVQLDLPAASFADDGERLASIEGAVERLEALPGVTAAAAANTHPRSPGVAQVPFTVEASPGDGEATPNTLMLAITPGFFEALGMVSQSGRLLAATDRRDSAPVAVINRSFAERHFADREALGSQIQLLGSSHRIVGVVGDAEHGLILNQGRQPTAYLPLAQQPSSTVVLTLATAGDPATQVSAVRQALARFDRRLVISQVQPLDDWVAGFFVGAQVLTTLLGAFGALALLLAALGTYGVLAYAVARRTHEIGVRMAIGARRGQVMGMVTRQGLLLAAVGIGLGLPGVLLVTRAVAATMSDLVPVQPGIVVAVAVTLALVTLVASWLPARRAATVDPVVALRSD